jgi:predicted alpha/beta-hydrolase family hydrolase
MVADEFKFNQLICLGYPFKHPDRPVERERFQHLSSLNTPCLIIQGTRDEYGNLDIVKQLGSVSSAIRYETVATDHDFKLVDGQQDRIVSLAKEFVGLGASS